MRVKCGGWWLSILTSLRDCLWYASTQPLTWIARWAVSTRAITTIQKSNSVQYDPDRFCLVTIPCVSVRQFALRKSPVRFIVQDCICLRIYSTHLPRRTFPVLRFIWSHIRRHPGYALSMIVALQQRGAGVGERCSPGMPSMRLSNTAIRLCGRDGGGDCLRPDYRWRAPFMRNFVGQNRAAY
jgi:hypothetical protein